MPNKQEKKKRKKGKDTAAGGAAAEVPHIPIEILIEKILPRVPPSILLRIASCSKELLRSLTYDTVLSSAVFAKPNSRGAKNLRMTIELLGAGQIWVPSPVRVLRLLAARTCELTAHRAPGAAAGAVVLVQCKGKLDFLRSWCGVHACWSCTQAQRTTTSSKRTRALRCHPRTATAGHSAQTLWTQDLMSAGGEKIGPHMTMATIRRLQGEADTAAAHAAHLRLVDERSAEKGALTAAYEVYKTNSKAHHTRVAQERTKNREESKKVKGDRVTQIWKDVAALLAGTAFAQRAMASRLAAELLRPYEKAPSKYKKTSAAQVANDLKSSFQLLPTTAGLAHSLGDTQFEAELQHSLAALVDTAAQAEAAATAGRRLATTAAVAEEQVRRQLSCVFGNPFSLLADSLQDTNYQVREFAKRGSKSFAEAFAAAGAARAAVRAMKDALSVEGRAEPQFFECLRIGKTKEALALALLDRLSGHDPNNSTFTYSEEDDSAHGACKLFVAAATRQLPPSTCQPSYPVLDVGTLARAIWTSTAAKTYQQFARHFTFMKGGKLYDSTFRKRAPRSQFRPAQNDSEGAALSKSFSGVSDAFDAARASLESVIANFHAYNTGTWLVLSMAAMAAGEEAAGDVNPAEAAATSSPPAIDVRSGNIYTAGLAPPNMPHWQSLPSVPVPGLSVGARVYDAMYGAGTLIGYYVAPTPAALYRAAMDNAAAEAVVAPAQLPYSSRVYAAPERHGDTAALDEGSPGLGKGKHTYNVFTDVEVRFDFQMTAPVSQTTVAWPVARLVYLDAMVADQHLRHLEQTVTDLSLEFGAASPSADAGSAAGFAQRISAELQQLRARVATIGAGAGNARTAMTAAQFGASVADAFAINMFFKSRANPFDWRLRDYAGTDTPLHELMAARKFALLAERQIPRQRGGRYFKDQCYNGFAKLQARSH